MKILIAHNFYQQPGGEDHSFRAESALLEAHGHTVSRYTVHNDQVKSMNTISLALATLWNRESYRAMRERIRELKPDLVHFHNTFPLISPSAYYAAKAEGIPVVQKLGNFRLLCPDALFFRDGKVCELCKDKLIKWPGVRYACYRNSRTASAVTASMLLLHTILRTWSQKVDVYIALTEFARLKFIEAGLPASKIVVKPNPIHQAPEPGTGEGNYALFVGRFSPEKGVETLLEAWKSINFPLKIAGDGPLSDKVRLAAEQNPQITWLGHVPNSEVYELLQHATVFIFPSMWYETFGRVIIEAYAAGTPVIASRLGTATELVQDGQTGLHFRAGDAADLAEKVTWLFQHPAELQQMRQAARHEFETKYTAERNYEQLIAIYERCL